MWLFLGFVNIVLAFFADYYYKSNKVTTFVLLGSIVIINTFFIGLRDFGVGYDTTMYIADYYNYAGGLHSFGDFLQDNSYYPHDKGFVVLAYIANLLGESKQSLLVVTEFFVTFFFVLGVYEYKKVTGISFAGFFILFWLLYQHETVNLMRQFCSMTLLFYGFAKFLQKKYVIYCFIQIIAFFFHSTSLLFLLVPMGYFLSNKENKYLAYIFVAIPVIGFFLVYNYYFEILHFFGDLNLVNDTLVNRYGEHSRYAVGKGHVNLKFLVPFIMIFMIYHFKILKERAFSMLLFLCVLTFLLEQTRFISQYFFRISYYIGLVFIVYFSEAFKYRYWNKLLCIQLLCIVTLFYYAYQSYTFMNSPTLGFMYRSKILGID